MNLPLDGIRVVSFDVDGTLYSTSRARCEVLRDAARAIAGGHLRKTLSELASLRRYYRSVEVARSHGGVLSPAEAHSPSCERRWLEPAIVRVGPRKGIVTLLESLRGVRLVATSDYEAEYKLSALGLRHYFEAVYEGVRLGVVKPSPQLFAHIAAQCAVTPGEILHIGDRDDTDGAGARSAGVRVVITKSFD